MTAHFSPAVLATVSLTPSTTTRSHTINPSTSIAFGNVRAQTTKIDSIGVTNTGYLDLDVTSIEISGPGSAAFSTPAVPFSIPPGVTHNISVYFIPPAAELYNAVIQVSVDNNLHSIDLSGTGIAPVIAVLPTSLDFDSTRISQSSADTVIISNTGTDTLNINQTVILGTGADHFSVEAPTDPVAPGEQLELPVTFSPLAAGDFTATLNILSDGGTGAGTADRYRYCSRARCFHQYAWFRQCFDTESRDITDSHFKYGNAPLTVTETLISGTDAGFFTTPVTGFILSSGGSRQVMITFSPNVVRTFNASITFYSNGGEETVTLTGSGITATLAVTPSTVNFGSSPVGVTVQDTLYIQNTGTASLSVSSVVKSGANAGAFNFSVTTPFTLTAGAVHELEIDFTPLFSAVITPLSSYRATAVI